MEAPSQPDARATPRLAFPREYDIELSQVGGKSFVFDVVRKKLVRLTPEEWVRQNFVRYLLEDRGFPRALTAIEHSLPEGPATFRADVLVLGRCGTPALIAECKAPEVPLREDSFDQVARYNRVARARLVVVTNGLEVHCRRVDWDAGSTSAVASFPRFDEI